MAAKIAGDDDAPISEINIVPFVDILLVVLIIFMVATPFIMKPSININLPKVASGDETAPSPMNLTITASGETFLNGKAVNDGDIGAFAAKAALRNPETQAVISADKDTSHGRVMAVIDVIKSNGIKKFAITIDKKK